MYFMQVLIGSGSGAVVATTTPDTYPDALIIKLTEDLQVTWQTSISGSGPQSVNELMVTSKGVIALGTAWSPEPIDITAVQAGRNSSSTTSFDSQVIQWNAP